MIEKRSFKILEKVIKSEDIRRLSEIFHDICADYIRTNYPDSKKTEYIREKYKIETRERITYSSSNLDIFKSGDVLDTKVVTSFTMSFIDSYKSTYIEIALADWQYYQYSNDLEIEGTDSTWVAGTFQKLVDYINSWENQSKIKQFKWPISILISLFIGWICGILIVLLLSAIIVTLKFSIFSPYIFPGLALCIGFFPFLADYIGKLWPVIEIVPGPIYERKLQKKRTQLWLFLVIIVIPFVINYFASLLANVTKLN